MRYLCRSANKIINNEQGIALISALMLGLIGMLMVLSLLALMDTGTWISGSKKRYQIALDAAHGGMNFFAKEIIQRGLAGTNLSAMSNYGDLNLTRIISDGDFITKLTTTGQINDGTYPNSTLDMTVTFPFPSAPSITVNSSIRSTSRGNSGSSSNILQGGGVVNNNSGNLTPQHIPYLYQTQTQGQNATSPKENAILSSIYAY